MQQLLQACYDAGDIELGLYTGKYCVPCELYYSDDDLLPGDLCPIHRKPVETVEEENYFFKLSRFEDRLLEWYDQHPNAIVPDFRANEVRGLIKGGLRDFSISRTSLQWGIPLPWDERHVTYVWFDALTNYITAVGYGSDPERFAEWWPVDYHLIGKDIIRQHCVYWPAMLLSAGLEPPKGWAVGGWLLVDGAKMSKTDGNVVDPLDLIDEVGVDGFRYYVLTAAAYGNDGDFSYEGLIGIYNSDLANNLGNLVSRVTTVVGSKCGGIAPAPARGQPARRGGGSGRRGRPGRLGRRAAQPSAGRDVEPDPCHQRLPGGQRAVEGRARARRRGGARRCAGGAANRRPAGLAGDPDDLAAGLGADRAGRQRRRAVARQRGDLGRLPGRCGGQQGRAAVPAQEGVMVHRGYTDSHCHIDDRLPGGADGAVAAARAAGVTRMITVGCDEATSRTAIEMAGRFEDVWATVGVHPHDAKDGLDFVEDLLAAPRVVAVGECGLDYHYDHSPRDVQRDAFAAQIALAHRHGLPLVIHSREAWDDTFDVLAGRGRPRADRVPLLHRRARRGAAVPRPRRVRLLLGHRDVQDGDRCPGGRPSVPVRSPADRDRQSLPRPRPTSREAQPAGARDRRR